MVISLNPVFLRKSISVLAHALYTIDFSEYLECSPLKIKELLEEDVGSTTRTISFDIEIMSEMFRDNNFRVIFKQFVGNCSFPKGVRIKATGLQEYNLVIAEKRVSLVKLICNKLEIKIVDDNNIKEIFISKSTDHMINTYNSKIEYLKSLEIKNIKIKEEEKKEEVQRMRNIPISNSTRSNESGGIWFDANHNNCNDIVSKHIEHTPSNSSLKKRKRTTPDTLVSSLTQISEPLDTQIMSASNKELITLFISEIKRRKISLQSTVFTSCISDKGNINYNKLI